MTDPGTADRTYIGPMTPELVEEIIAKVKDNETLSHHQVNVEVVKDECCKSLIRLNFSDVSHSRGSS